MIIIGAGIAGSSLARELAAGRDVEVVVLEAADGDDSLRGSTGYAPGSWGCITTLRSSHSSHGTVPRSTTASRTPSAAPVGSRWQRRRTAQKSSRDAPRKQAGQRSRWPRSGRPRSVRLAPAVVGTDRMVSAWAYADDAIAYTRLLVQGIRGEARARGARFVAGATVVAIDPAADGELLVTVEGGERFAADAVVLCGGVWAPSLAALVGVELPLIPVAHPYVCSPPRADFQSGSFVRWPEHHVYARVHGDRLGPRHL